VSSTLAWWAPVVGAAALIAGVEAAWGGRAGLFQERGVRLDPAPALVTHLAMLSGAAGLVAAFSGLRHWQRCRGIPPRPFPDLCPAPLAAAALWIVWLSTLAVRFNLPEDVLATGLFVYLPTLVLTFGFAGLGLRRLRQPGAGLAVLGGLVVLCGCCQIASLDPRGQARNELIFALPSVPIVLAVVFWLVADAGSVADS
jgi:hypothetical protein